MLYALTKLPTAFVAALVSRAIENVVPVVSTFCRPMFSPPIASLTVFVGFVIASPSIEKFALTASDSRVVCAVPPDAAGSNASCESPALSTSLPSASLVRTRNPLTAPVFAPVSTSRLPLPSLTIDATTPAFAPLMASRMPVSESLVLSIVIDLLPAEPFGVNVVWFASQLPTSIVIVPVPTVVVGLVNPLDAVRCVSASCETFSVCEPAVSEPLLVLSTATDAMLLSPIDAAKLPNAAGVVSDVSVDWNVDSALVTCPNADSFVW